MPSIKCPIQKHAKISPAALAILDGHTALTYIQLNNLINETTHHLKSFNIRPYSRVAILSPNSTSCIVLLWALWRMKIVTLILNKRNPKETIYQQIKNTRCKILFTDEFIKLKLKQIKISTVTGKTQNTSEETSQNFFNTQNDLTILYTSGSTGKPKAALHNFGNHYFSALGSNEHIPFQNTDRWLCNLPIYHVGGLSILFRVFLAGGSFIVTQTSKTIINEIKEKSPSHISVVASQLIGLLDNKKDILTFKKLKCILLGGSAMPDNLLKTCSKFKLPVYISYGLTEMSSQIMTSYKLQFNKLKTLRFRQIRINANQEIEVKGKTLFQGYLVNNKIIKPFNRNGWFKTGDLGQKINRQCIKILGRKDNLIISGGENIQPEEIERHLLKIPQIKLAIVIGKKDRDYGQRPVAFLQKTKPITATRINTILKKQLPKFKIPDQYFQWPKTATMTAKPSRSYFKKLIEV